MHFRKIAVLAVGLLLTGCAQGADATSAVENQQIKETQADALVASETWAKAAESGMSAAFGVLHNDSDQPLALHQVSNALGDEIQIHEMRGSGHDMSMAQLDGDLVIEPGQDLVLAPGGNHFMFMDLKRPLLAAQSVRAATGIRRWLQCGSGLPDPQFRRRKGKLRRARPWRALSFRADSCWAVPRPQR